MNDFSYGICCGDIVRMEQIEVPKKSKFEIYEVVRVINNKILYFEEHMDRMEQSIRFYFPNFNLKRKSLLDSIRRLIDKSNIENMNIRIEGYLQESGDCQVIAHLIKGEYPTQEMYNEGIMVRSIDYLRLDPGVKLIDKNYKAMMNIIIKKENIYEVILYHCGKIAEGSKSNIFFIKDNKVFSPRQGDILSGITRKKVLETFNILKIEVVEEDILINEVDTYEAAFITGTSIHILPILKFDDYTFNPNHQLLKDIMEEFKKTIKKYLTA